MICFGKGNLQSGEVAATGDRSPGWRSMPASKKLLILGGMATVAIEGRGLLGNSESSVIDTFLVVQGLVTVKTSDSAFSVRAGLKLMNYGRGFMLVALGALSGRTSKIGRRLIGFNRRTEQIDDDRSHKKR